MYYRGAHLITTLLQQTFYKLPVGLSNDRGREVGELGLPDAAAQVPRLLDVFLQIKMKRNNFLTRTDLLWSSMEAV